MSGGRRVSVPVQRLVDFVFVVAGSALLRSSAVALLLAGFSVGRSMRGGPLLCNG
jgi:hypothetical protein